MKRYLKWESEKFNTNNGWGFGGGIGVSYKKDGWEVRKGKAFFRHVKSRNFLTVKGPGQPRIDVDEKTLDSILEKAGIA